jgi:predicted Fe-Mo cluster-binding NifX family protein
MQIAISLNEDKGHESTVSPIFGRCPYFMFIDPQTMSYSVEENPAKDATGGAGIQAAQMVADKKPDAVISGQFGPKAERVLEAAGIPAYVFQNGNVKQALEALQNQTLARLNKSPKQQ